LIFSFERFLSTRRSSGRTRPSEASPGRADAVGESQPSPLPAAFRSSSTSSLPDASFGRLPWGELETWAGAIVRRGDPAASSRAAARSP